MTYSLLTLKATILFLNPGKRRLHADGAYDRNGSQYAMSRVDYSMPNPLIENFSQKPYQTKNSALLIDAQSQSQSDIGVTPSSSNKNRVTEDKKMQDENTRSREMEASAVAMAVAAKYYDKSASRAGDGNETESSGYGRLYINLEPSTSKDGNETESSGYGRLYINLEPSTSNESDSETVSAANFKSINEMCVQRCKGGKPRSTSCDTEDTEKPCSFPATMEIDRSDIDNFADVESCDSSTVEDTETPEISAKVETLHDLRITAQRQTDKRDIDLRMILKSNPLTEIPTNTYHCTKNSFSVLNLDSLLLQAKTRMTNVAKRLLGTSNIDADLRSDKLLYLEEPERSNIDPLIGGLAWHDSKQWGKLPCYKKRCEPSNPYLTGPPEVAFKQKDTSKFHEFAQPVSALEDQNVIHYFAANLKKCSVSELLYLLYVHLHSCLFVHEGKK